jgi:hypothetical protein
MSNLNDIDDKQLGITLGGKAKEFEWKYDGEKIIISREFGKLHNNIQTEFTNNEISLILSYIKYKGKAYLSNSVSKLQDGTEKDGIGKFIYENIKSDTTFAQTASQLVSIFVKANILEYNGKKRNMEFWLVDEEWEKALLKC